MRDTIYSALNDLDEITSRSDEYSLKNLNYRTTEAKVNFMQLISYRKQREKITNIALRLNLRLLKNNSEEFYQYLEEKVQEIKDKIEIKIIDDEEILSYMKENPELYNIKSILKKKKVQESIPPYYSSYNCILLG